MRIFLFILLVLTFSQVTYTTYGQAQSGNPGTVISGQDSMRRPITTAVPFLRITPDARHGALGDIGVATSPDVNAAYFNPAKVAFNTHDFAGSISYTPWLAKIIDDMYIAHLSGFKKITREQAVALSFTYFDLGNIQLVDDDAQPLGDRSPNELSLNFTYSRILSDIISIGITAKYIRSNLLGNFTVGNEDFNPANAFAVDLGFYFTKDILVSGSNSNISAGAAIQNLGNKITYSSDREADFLPMNLKIGTAFKTDLNPYNTIMFGLDFNKLLVPTLAEDNDRNILSGMFSSFADAPDGFSEELREITISSGIEYWYRDLFSARAGYFWEHEDKGNRKYFTLGVGFRYQVFGVDFAYLLPTQQNNPLADTLRFTVLFNFNKDENTDSINDRQN
jgi:hypothetical protein